MKLGEPGDGMHFWGAEQELNLAVSWATIIDDFGGGHQGAVQSKSKTRDDRSVNTKMQPEW